MIKHISIIRRHSGVSREEFRRYWIDVHAPLVKQSLPGLRRYIGNFPDEGGRADKWGLQDRSEILDCDLIVELHFDDMKALKSAMLGPAWLNDKRRASSAKLIDYGATLITTVAEEYDVPL
ncbi:MAG: EthD domain-containing protein [Roseiarcus sp.]|jgi:uncharacterized protein (TIGR02118 family)